MDNISHLIPHEDIGEDKENIVINVTNNELLRNAVHNVLGCDDKRPNDIPMTDRKLINNDLNNDTNYLQMNNKVIKTQNNSKDVPFKFGYLFDYLRSELRRNYVLENDEQRYEERREKFYIFLRIPLQLEKFLCYGFFQCVDAFLFVFTLLPIRFALSLWFLITRSFNKWFCLLNGQSWQMTGPLKPLEGLEPSEICDLMKGVIVLSGVFLMSYIDTSMLYHIIKSQSVIKLYIFFNMLEVADKLLSSFGQDILDALFWTANEPRGKKREHLGVIPHLFMAIAYVFMHSLLVLLQATTLNVAINSKNKALLTVMMSNNFVELKGMVFKKFEKTNLFQMSCSDVRERFHYIILLIVVIIQTMKEYNWSEKQFWILFPDCLLVFIAEIFVDWFKHAFVTRFNEISFEVYEEYAISLAYDLASSKLKSAFSDHSDLISRRMGFIPLPLGVLVIRIMSGSFHLNCWYGLVCLFVSYLCLVSFKLVVNIVLLGQACDLIEAHRKTIDDKVGALSRQYTSLPASRHNSCEDIPSAVSPHAKSTPHTPSPSTRSSLADITQQAAIMQETLESSMIFSNSTVSLNSLDINDGTAIKFTVTSGTSDLKLSQKSILRQRHVDNQFKRRVSLQEMTSDSSIIPFLDLSVNENKFK
ncbi:transmembrane anterior posterior transformation protein 1 homolog [Oppia nitens]|uniref:transmembrane anterior posterior transformation protein 1 homolog n=1 Tax=Oppia nitens TaxID=1686743 RepID=UPI0023DC5661|nr:transmembrane anterior posterior transformation protein 1 homolog [Oppia nitens]XP_054161108.1 transmembrane anterior posterior transformation protein 1 homolog [Oppia nitens]